MTSNVQLFQVLYQTLKDQVIIGCIADFQEEKRPASLLPCLSFLYKHKTPPSHALL
jgi:hypothetical protein